MGRPQWGRDSGRSRPRIFLWHAFFEMFNARQISGTDPRQLQEHLLRMISNIIIITLDRRLECG